MLENYDRTARDCSIRSKQWSHDQVCRCLFTGKCLDEYITHQTIEFRNLLAASLQARKKGACFTSKFSASFQLLETHEWRFEERFSYMFSCWTFYRRKAQLSNDSEQLQLFGLQTHRDNVCLRSFLLFQHHFLMLFRYHNGMNGISIIGREYPSVVYHLLSSMKGI